MAGAKKTIPGASKGSAKSGNVVDASPVVDKSIVPITQGGGGGMSETEFTRWLGEQPRDVQEAYDEAGAISDHMKQVAFLRNSVALPGIGPNGEGVVDAEGNAFSDKKRLASAAAAAEAKRGQNLEADFNQSISPEDFAYQATLDEGTGYSPQDRYRFLGKASPLEQAIQEQAINQGRTDETGLQAQQDALAGYRDIYGQGGLTAMDRANMEKANRIGRMRGRAAEGAIMQDAAEQGRGGGNLEFLARAGAQQAATQQISDQGLQTQALALARKDQALAGMAGVGGQVQTAQDAIDNFNAEGERTRVRENLERQNFATTSEWGENNARESGNANQFNRGVDLGFATDTARSSANADRTNTASQLNVSPGQGVRGMFRDRLGMREAAAGRGQNAAGILQQGAISNDQNQAAKEAAIIGAIGGVVNAGVQAGTYAATQPKKKT